MLNFTNLQKVYNISGVEIGGQPGERPTILISSIFFASHQIVHDPVRGLFDREMAKDLLDQEAELSLKYGNPRFIDVIGETTKALVNYIEFVVEQTSSPILVDSPSQRVRIEVVRHFAHSEVMPRLIYNAIAEDHTDEELDCLRECGVKSAIILAFSTKAMKPKAKLKLLQEDLLSAAESAGIENIIIDAGVLDVPSVSWASATIREIKGNLGYPAGCAPANAIYTWDKVKALGTATFQAAASVVLAATQSQGADFIMYGSIKNASWVYPIVATMDALVAYGNRLNDVQPATREHPLYKIF
jgi:tetrahydromethanopterin S-methyltransferase subunit H